MDEKRALITGINGFTGPYIKTQLELLGYQVFGLSLSDAPVASNTHSIDLLDIESVASFINSISPSVVVHLAGQSFAAHDDISGLYLANIIGTRNLLESLARLTKSPELVLLASTANIYSSVDSDQDSIDEDTPLDPGNDYGVSKLAMENMASLWAQQLPITIVRPFNYVGVGQSSRFVVPKIVSHFAGGSSTIELGNLDVYRDFSDVRFVAKSYVGLIENNVAGEIVNICSGCVYSLNDIISMMKTISGNDIAVEVNPAFVRKDEIYRLCGNNKKLMSLVDVLPSNDLYSTLEWIYQEHTA